MNPPELITLNHGATHLQVCPAAGGSIVRFWHDAGGGARDWLRPVSQEALNQRRGREMGLYPLAPYCNRIRAGQFSWQDRSIKLPLNVPMLKHSMHGHAWQAAWQVIAASDEQVILEYHHPADAWPWDYRVRQTLSLGRQTLQVDLQLENLSDSAMPAGLGVHPYFIRTPKTRVYAQTDQIWLTDAEIMPVERATPEPARDPRRGIWVDRVALDNNYTGWGGLARIQWPEWGAEMTVSADPPFDHLVVYSPAEQPIVCVEPVSHTTDAVNLAEPAGSGLRSLEPGQMLSAWTRFHYDFIEEGLE